jgi:hypothetical protein
LVEAFEPLQPIESPFDARQARVHACADVVPGVLHLLPPVDRAWTINSLRFARAMSRAMSRAMVIASRGVMGGVVGGVVAASLGRDGMTRTRLTRFQLEKRLPGLTALLPVQVREGRFRPWPCAR